MAECYSAVKRNGFGAGAKLHVAFLDGKGVILVLDESRLNGSEHLFGHLKSELARICGKSFKLELLEGKDNAAQEARQKAAEAEAMKVPFVRDFLAAMPESRLIVDDSSKPDGV